jgi:hypothetical protein
VIELVGFEKEVFIAFLNMESTDFIIRKTRDWVEHFVIRLNLCPFAKKVFDEEKIRYVVLNSHKIADLTKMLLDELFFLNKTNPSRIETTLLICPNLLQDFGKFNDYLAIADEILIEMSLIGEIQIASFHPQYQFAGTQPNDPENYTNRSPYPMLHLLREESIEKALKNFPHPEEIPKKNIEKMNQLGLEKLKNWKNEP